MLKIFEYLLKNIDKHKSHLQQWIHVVYCRLFSEFYIFSNLQTNGINAVLLPDF